jgi:preprotein translocase subunit SecD
MLKLTALPFLFFAALLSASERGFAIGGEAFSQDEIVDARALPQLGGGASIMITLSDSGAKRIATLTQKRVGGTVAVAIDGETISNPTIREPILDGVVQISAQDWSIASAAALAKRISGKDPLPDSLDE